MNQTTLISHTAEAAETVDKQIQENQKITDFEIREWPIEVLVNKFITGAEKDEAEIFIPDYQRDFIWTAKQQSRFIESIIMNVPIPPVFLGEDQYGSYVVLDGRQRLTAINDFLRNAFKLKAKKVWED